MKQIKVKIKPDIFSYDTYVTAQATSGVGTLTVKSITDFAINQNLMIGDLGGESSEIVKTHGSTAPTGSTITLSANLAFTHPIYSKVKISAYDQIEFSHAATVTGVKTVMATKTIDVQRLENIYEDSTYTSGYYFYRFVNSIPAPDTYSDYSDPIPFDGFTADTVDAAIKYALKRNKLDSYTKYVDFDFCIDEINTCLRFITGKLKRWSKLQEFDYPLGQTECGVNQFVLPDDIWENENNKSILNVRLGSGQNLKWLRKEQWDIMMEGVNKSAVSVEGTVGATTLTIENSYDFADSGSVDYWISGTLHTLTYTGVTRSTTAGVLTGIPASGDGSITVTTPVGTNIWQGESIGEPMYYTVYYGSLFIWYLPSANYDNGNIVLDYYTAPVSVESEGDYLDVFRYDAVKYWLTAAIRGQLKNDGKKDLKDGDLEMSLQIIKDYVSTELPAHSKKSYPFINGIKY